MDKVFLKSQRNSPGPGFYGESEPRYSLRDSINLKSVLYGRQSSIDRTELSTAIEDTARTRSTCNTALGIRDNNTSLSKANNPLLGSFRTDVGYSFGGAQDRFLAPTKKVGAPAPNTYTLSNSIGFENGMNNPYKATKNANLVFGKDETCGIDQLLALGTPDFNVPGPGKY